MVEPVLEQVQELVQVLGQALVLGLVQVQVLGQALVLGLEMVRLEEVKLEVEPKGQVEEGAELKDQVVEAVVPMDQVVEAVVPMDLVAEAEVLMDLVVVEVAMVVVIEDLVEVEEELRDPEVA